MLVPLDTYLTVAETAFWKAVRFDDDGSLHPQGDAEFWMGTARTAIAFVNAASFEKSTTTLVSTESEEGIKKIWQTLEAIEVALRK